MAPRHWQTWTNFIVMPVLLLAATVADFTTECQRPCDCRWQSGNKAAVCSNASLKTIPTNLSSDIQILDLSNNHLTQLHREVFRNVGLSNLKKLFLKDCNIEVVHKAAFLTLAIMIELDLSKNQIRYLHPDTFKGTEKLRLINLSYNFIDKLEDGLFRNLKFLQKVALSNNLIAKIETEVFVNLPQLRILRFDGNNLTHMKPETLKTLGNLSSLDLYNNPWRCDCNLQTFRHWVMSRNLYTPPTSCAEPPAIRNKLWSELDSSKFACRPTILEPLPDSIVKSFEVNVTLTCQVVSNPSPDVAWRFNGKTIDLKTFGEIKYIVKDNVIDLIRWVNLTIVNARYSDRGNYTCVAENPGGRDEKTLFLELPRYGNGSITGMDAETLVVFISCLTAIFIILSAVIAFCYFSNQNGELKRLIKNEARSSNSDVLIKGSENSEPRKIESRVISPLTKPPSKYEPAPLTNEAMEMSAHSKTSLDNDSDLDGAREGAVRSLEVTLPKLSQESLLIGRLTQHHQPYPPDLLSVPLRGTTRISPGVSGDSNTRHSPENPPGYTFTSTKYGPATCSRYRSPTLYTSTMHLVTTKDNITLPRKTKRHERQNLSNSIYDNFNMKIYKHNNYYTINNIKLGLEPSGQTELQGSDEMEPAPSPAPGSPHATVPRMSVSSRLQAVTVNSHGIYYESEHRPLKAALATHGNYPENATNDLRINYSGIGEPSKRTTTKPLPKPRKHTSDLIEPLLTNASASENATRV